jgi:hypothetical protein
MRGTLASEEIEVKNQRSKNLIIMIIKIEDQE